MDCAYLTDLATSIWNELGEPTDMPVSYIQSVLVSNAFLGDLNVLTTNCHVTVSGAIDPPLDVNEQALASLMYQRNFYTSKLNQIANGTDIPFVSIQDGDSRITRVNFGEMMKVYRDMQKQLNMQVNNLAYNYRQADAMARSVSYLNIDNSWNGSAAFDGGGIVN